MNASTADTRVLCAALESCELAAGGRQCATALNESKGTRPAHREGGCIYNLKSNVRWRGSGEDEGKKRWRSGECAMEAAIERCGRARERHSETESQRTRENFVMLVHNELC